MAFHVPHRHRIIKGLLASDDKIGNNGAFEFKVRGLKVRVVASDGLGWEHVSVSLERKKCPNWNTMCEVKNIFWDEEDAVIQYHPPKSQYVNCHPFTLHLWKSTDKEIPVPDPILVGPP